jgi:protein-L-isoaspartate(D-aspartate) O-methyltransferase
MANNFEELRKKMVEKQLINRGIEDEKVIDAFAEVPREEFVGEKYKSSAYDDGPLPIGSGQTISQPYIVALMIDSLNLNEDDKVLEIGTGSGYAAAVLAKIVNEVYTIEKIDKLAEKAKERFKKLNYTNISTKVGDGTLGWEENAPYDGIVVSAAAPHVPEALINQLAESGKIIIPVGEDGGVQRLKLIKKTEDGTVNEENLDYVRFVPLLGENGYK